MIDPIILRHSWPLWEYPEHLDYGYVLNSAITDMIGPAQNGVLGSHHVGVWECDLADSSLVWSGGVYDIFGFARGTHVTREESLACYDAPSRAALERLRAHTIRHKRGFTLDVRIAPATGPDRAVRLITVPVCENGKVVRLRGLKILL